MKKIYPLDFDKLEETIIKSGKTLSGFAKDCGISRQYIHKIFKKRSTISPRVAKKIHEISNKYYDELFFVK